MNPLLFVLAAICLIFGVLALVDGSVLLGLALIVVGLFLGGGSRGSLR